MGTRPSWWSHLGLSYIQRLLPQHLTAFAVTYYLNVQTVAAAAMLYSPYYLKIHTVVAAAMLHSSYLNIHTAVAAVTFHIRTYSTQQQALNMASYNGKVT